MSERPVPPAPNAGLHLDIEVDRGTFQLRISCDVAPGEVLAVLGPNGAGKSTLLRALAGLTPISAGRITLEGAVLDDAGTGEFVEASRRPVGLVFQSHRLFPHLSVLDNVAFAARAAGQDRAESRRTARQWIGRLDLGGLADRKPAALSGGQSQRVALARALAREPGLLLLDEPLSALDARTRMGVQGELRRHLREFPGPCVLVTHDPLEALVLADRLLVVEDGAVMQQGSPLEVTRRPATEFVAKLVGLNLYAGHGHGNTVTLEDGSSFVLAEHVPADDVLVAIRPSAVIVGTERPIGTSVRNTWPGVVSGLTMLAERVRLDITGSPPVVADVTAAAVAELSLVAGTSVWMSVKATDLETYPQNSGRSGSVPALG